MSDIKTLKIWVDADACPRVIKEILFRAAVREKLTTILVSNKPLRTPESPYIRTIIVPSGFDVADEHILEQVERHDLVITADIPLAAAVIENGAHVITPRGKIYTKDNVREQLSYRNFMDDLRGAGISTGGPAPLNRKDRELFANHFNAYIRSFKMTD